MRLAMTLLSLILESSSDIPYVHKKKVRTSELSNRIKKYRRMAPAANKTQNPKTQEPFAPLSRASGA
jgi:hypothetical protein